MLRRRARLVTWLVDWTNALRRTPCGQRSGRVPKYWVGAPLYKVKRALQATQWR
jgi:hypothetical protein